MAEALLQDLRYAVRYLLHSPGFTLTALLTLALGIGANTALFSVLNAVVLRPLAVRDPGSLIAISSMTPQGQMRGTPLEVVRALNEAPGSLTEACGYSGGGFYATEADGAPWQTLVELVTGRCLSMLGVEPRLGRLLNDADGPPAGNGPPVVVIGHGFWQRALGSRTDIIGTTIRIEGTPVTIVGVMPASYTGLQLDVAPDVILPFNRVNPAPPGRVLSAISVIARVRAGAARTAVEAEISSRWPALVQAHGSPTTSPGERPSSAAGARITPIGTGFSYLRATYGSAITLVTGLCAVLLIMACVNLGGLLLARLAARQNDITVRTMLGASRGRVVQQIVTESLVLAVAGAALALPLAWWICSGAASLLWSGTLPLTVTLTPDVRVLLASTAAVLAVAGLMSLLPATLVTRATGHQGQAWHRTIAGTTTRWGHAALVAQLALSVVLLFCGGLFVRSLVDLRAVNPGFRPDGVLVARVMPLPGAYRNLDHASYYPALVERLAALPGVASVGYARMFSGFYGDPSISYGNVARVDSPLDQTDALGVMEIASPGFFRTVGMPIRAGRDFSWSDNADAPKVVVLSESLAKTLFGSTSPIGRQVRDAQRQQLTIVGVVGDATLGSFRRTDVPILYRPPLQETAFGRYPRIHVRVAGDPTALIEPVRAAITSMGREYAARIATVNEELSVGMRREELTAGLSMGMTGLAVLLVFLGVHGMLAYAVARRTRELGVRMAVGATRGRVLRLVLRESVTVALTGALIGVPCALFAGRYVETLLYGVTASDRIILAGAALFPVLVAALAGLIPARRAATVDPTVAMRCE